MPFGYVDPVQQVREQQALRQIARQPPGCQQRPMPYQPPAGPEVGYLQPGPRQYMRPSAGDRVQWAAIGAAVGLVVYRNWHRRWVRVSVTWIGSFLLAWLASFIGARVVQAVFFAAGASGGLPVAFWAFLFATAVSGVLAVVAGRQKITR